MNTESLIWLYLTAKPGGYKLDQIYRTKLENKEILAMAKILLDSRSLTKIEMDSILERLITSCVPETSRKLVKNLIKVETFHYIEPRHKKKYLDDLWEIGIAAQEHRYIEIEYQGIQGSSVKTRKLKPLAIIFSEMYFI